MMSKFLSRLNMTFFTVISVRFKGTKLSSMFTVVVPECDMHGTLIE